LIQRNPINRGSQKENLNVGYKKKYITGYTYTRLNSSNAILPRAYGLPKIHKTDYPLRTIVSSIGSPLHNLATFLLKILRESLSISVSNFKNSIEVVKKLNNIHIPADHVLVSLDVISLFTNVLIDLIMDLLDEKWCLIERHTIIPKQELMNAIKFVLNSTYFKFNDKIYRQIFGTSMGSPLSPIVADLIMQDLESHTLKNLPFIPPFYIKYVDDIVMAASHTYLNELLNKFNAFHPRLKFAMEIGSTSLNFLEVAIINKNG